MFPTVCHIGPVAIYSYGLMLAVAVVVCSFLMRRDARIVGWDPDLVYDLVFWAVLSGILGARLFYVILNLDFFIASPLQIIMIPHGGLSWQGGLICGALSVGVFIRRKHLPFGVTVDMVAPYLALGQAIGRIGCFLNGCCYGRPVSWGIYFPVHNARLHPTQLYATAGLTVVFFLLRALRKKGPGPGTVFAAYLVLASAQRFVIEFFRADHDLTALGFSVFQWVSLGVGLAGAVLLLAIAREKRT